MNIREVIADNLSEAGWSWGYVSAIDCNGRPIWIADAHRGDGKRYVVHAKKLTAFLELEAAIRKQSLHRIKENHYARPAVGSSVWLGAWQSETILARCF